MVLNLKPTLITTTMFNAILNPYAGKRPKTPEKIYDMKKMFEKIVKEHPSLPARVSLSDVHSNTNKNGRFVDYVEIAEVYACLPGGRGCVGRERMGKKFLDRQVAVYTKKGVKTNPRYAANDHSTNYGFLNMVGKIHYIDGKESNINIPIEPSGVVGLRTGASTMALVDPNVSNVNNTRGNKLLGMVMEIQEIIFGLLGIVATSTPSFGMINGMFNIYTNEKKKMRPKMNNFVSVAKQLQKHPVMSAYYQKAAMPWLKVQQQVPTIMKAIFKPLSKLDAQKNYITTKDDLPTVTLSPYGHVEILGAKSIKSMIRGYEIIMQSMKDVQMTVSIPPPIAPVPTFTKSLHPQTQAQTQKKKRDLTTMYNSSLVILRRGQTVFIKNKECTTLPKPILVRILASRGLPVKGTKQTLCDRLISVINTI
jgi:hypothetical protein